MNIRQLSAFQAVMSSGGAARAADVLHVTQSAVSQQIALLEADCGFQLFDRSSNRLRPTREAEALMVEVEAMFEGVRKVDRVVAAIREHRWGAISIASFPAIARRFLPRTVARFGAGKADVQFHLQSMRSRTLIDAVATRQADMALSFLPADRDDTESLRVQRLKAVCILPLGHRLAEAQTIWPEDLRDEPFVSLGPQDMSRLVIDKLFDEHQVPRRISIETGQSDAACAVVAEGVACAVVDPISAWTNSGADFVVRPFGPEIQFDVWLIRSRTAPPNALLDDFIAFLTQEMDDAEYSRLS
ncbi:LysR family transcriptional regulator [Nitratireductor aquimarinus]|uniref:LysR substrate-binding domain-containing protein n=1 Tax=Nitratireductor TaxID=245876 RepID=UPI0019D4015B|nr:MULTISPECIES: LysR substrate-binding domain-containing protein [Nitratireductor]MBN7776618.1 LysR family transcriptional regulator [Nitratireductor pacificus]MBN7779485.1 LysR family transcriptional regulator [Nitratireductor pacificus]MBN7788292.1 LysR family transcriptional regulator [Nitratireductor aquimarinus]MBY6098339.1 LysR family transcriptional regulator [Nitratireductor aquimarinus]MCA1261023.1 LysR family transcriptional regulator [Nitratireductor aquimarinus]